MEQPGTAGGDLSIGSYTAFQQYVTLYEDTKGGSGCRGWAQQNLGWDQFYHIETTRIGALLHVDSF